MPRRGNHEGSIRLRDGRWEASVQFAGRRYWVSGRTQTQARKRLADLKRKHHVGELVPPTRLSLGEFLDKWIDANRAEWKPKTLNGYEAIVRNYWKPELGHVRLQRVTPSMIASAYTRWKADRGIGGGTLLNVHRCLHRALRVAVLWGYLAQSPADRVEPPKARRKRPTMWSRDQVTAFLATTSDDRWGVMWSVLVGTGCRLGEALALRWGDANLDTGTLTIERSVTWVTRATRCVVTPKTEAGTRTVQLPKQTVEALRWWKARQAAERLRLGAQWRCGDSVVSLPDGRHPSPWQAWSAFQRACGVAGAPRSRIHDLRHLSASILLAEGMPLPVVSARLGHATTAVTASVYSHLIGDGDAEAASALETAMGHSALS